MNRIAVLMGGVSAEREVSLVTGQAVCEALATLGYCVDPIDVGADVAALAARLTPAPDVAFNALHGRFGEDGCIQGLLELMGIPYTHSGIRASALAMDKAASKAVFRTAGISVPEGAVVSCEDVHDTMPAPYVIKPVAEGSSVGIIIVEEGSNAVPLTAETWPFGTKALVERYIPGRELTVAVNDDRALGVLEIRPYQGFYDYDTKYTEERADHLIPAPVDDEVAAQALDIAERAHMALGCRSVTRADFRYDEQDGGLYLLEVNTQPGLTPLSLVPEIAAYAGIDFPSLVQLMTEAARCDF